MESNNWNLESPPIFPGSPVAYFDYKYHLSRFVFLSQFVNEKVVLEVGCGTGYGTHYLSTKGARKIVGIDISDEALKVARMHFANPGLEFRRMSAEKLEFPDNSFDVVYSFGSIDHIEHQDQFLSEVRRVLRPGGLFACSVLNKEYLTPVYHKKPLDLHHSQEFNPDKLAVLVAGYLPVYEVRGVRYHNRSWWQLRFILLNTAAFFHFTGLLTRFTRVMLKKTYELISYTTDSVDRDLGTSLRDWRIINPDSDSSSYSFMVLAKKSPV